MARFRKTASPEKQALSVAKSLQRSGHIQSVRTLNNYRERLEIVASNLSRFGIQGEIRSMSVDTISGYLTHRASEVGQKTLDMERQALQAMARHVTQEILPETTLVVTKADRAQLLTGRAYTSEQVGLIRERQTGRHSLATQIAYAAGLRASELHSLLPASERGADKRPATDSKWDGRSGTIYTVQGKGGLVREVLIPRTLAERLEATRLDKPITVTDRGVHYTQHYAIGAGQKWSNSFSGAAERALGWSTGAHGVRHSYAQERMTELQTTGLAMDAAKETVSQELGHFRPDITDTYLR